MSGFGLLGSTCPPSPRRIQGLQTTSAEGRILITEDRDFGELVVRQRLGVRGVVLLELDRLSNPAEADLVSAVVAANEGKLAGSLVVIEPGRVRVRPLPW